MFQQNGFAPAHRNLLPHMATRNLLLHIASHALDFTNQWHKFWGFIGQLYIKVTLEPIRTQNLGKLSQSNINLRSPNCHLVRSYLIATVKNKCQVPDHLPMTVTSSLRYLYIFGRFGGWIWPTVDLLQTPSFAVPAQRKSFHVLVTTIVGTNFLSVDLLVNRMSETEKEDPNLKTN